MSRIYARAVYPLGERDRVPFGSVPGRLSGITDGSGLRTCTPIKRRASVAIRRGACLVSSCVDGSCLIPTTTTASTTKTSPMTATARINIAGINAQLLTDRTEHEPGSENTHPVAHPPVSTAREIGGYVAALQWPQIAGPVCPFEPRRLHLG
jgi:hypothetical protein